MLFDKKSILAAFAGAVVLASKLAVCEPIPLRSDFRRSTLVVKESSTVPAAWSRVGRGAAAHGIELRIAVKQGDFESLEKQLYEVSDPKHPRYGQHLSKSQVNDLVRPKQESLDLVHDWLADNDIPQESLRYSDAQDWIFVTLPVHHVEKLLDTQYSVYRHKSDNTEALRTPRWSLPRNLHDHIDTIQPTTSFFRAKSSGKKLARRSVTQSRSSEIGHGHHARSSTAAQSSTIAEACNTTSGITPNCLRTLYGTVDYVPQVPGSNKVGLTDYLGESNRRSDIYQFLQEFRPDAAASACNFTLTSIANGSTSQSLTLSQLAAGTDLEGDLDAEILLSTTFPTPLIAYSTGGSPPFTSDNATTTNTNEPYLTWLLSILSLPSSQIPQTISTSYGDDEQTIPISYATRACNAFAQLGAQGITLLTSSGDHGVGPTDSCVSNDGTATPRFLPQFPATCPFVTAVGATTSYLPEIAAYDARNAFASGGGFSDYFARPGYQDSVVPGYLRSLDADLAPFFNASGRGYPDVSAQGLDVLATYNGSVVRLDGTSASAPAAAGVFALVNDALLASGKPPLGWLNPWLYTAGEGAFTGCFTDVMQGSARGCGELTATGGKGFPAKAGWDAVTGFGTPYFPVIVGVLGVASPSQ